MQSDDEHQLYVQFLINVPRLCITIFKDKG